MKEIKFRILSDGSKYWFLKGKQHRENGPATIYPNGSQYWYLNGKFIKDNEDEKDSI